AALDRLTFLAQPPLGRLALLARASLVGQRGAGLVRRPLVCPLPLARRFYAPGGCGFGVDQARLQALDLALLLRRGGRRGCRGFGGHLPCDGQLAARAVGQLLGLGPRGLERRETARLLAAFGRGGAERLGEPRPGALRFGEGGRER